MVMDSFVRQIRMTGPNPNLSLQNVYDYWANWNQRSVIGAGVHDQEALGLTAFFRGIQIIASTLAMLPLDIHQTQPDGTTLQLSTTETAYLWHKPNDEITIHTL